MAYMCTYGKNQECDGCLDCHQALGGGADEDMEEYLFRCEDCGEVAEEDGYYYDVEGLVLCSHCLDKRYRKEAS